MRVRRGVVAVAGAVGVMLALAASAWACVAASGPFMADAVPNRVPVLSATEVSGGGWAASTPANIGLATSPSGQVQPLAVATTSPSGELAASVTVPETQPGAYYLVVTQGSITRAMPFEVSAAPTSAPSAVAAPAAPAIAASGQDWGGLRADGARTPGLGDLPATTHNSSSPLPALAVMGGTSLALAGLALAEVRRRKVAAHAEVRTVA